MEGNYRGGLTLTTDNLFSNADGEADVDAENDYQWSPAFYT